MWFASFILIMLIISICLNVSVITALCNFFLKLQAGLNVPWDAEQHVFTQLGYVNGLVALVDYVGVALPSLTRVSHGFMTHPSVKLLSPFLGSCLFQLEDLLRKKVLQKLVFVAYFEELRCLSLIIIKHYLKLGDPLFAGFAYPVVDFLMGTVQARSIIWCTVFKNLCSPSKTLE